MKAKINFKHFYFVLLLSLHLFCVIVSQNIEHENVKNILRFTNDQRVVVDIEPLEKMLEHPEVKDRKIVVFSTLGSQKNDFFEYCLKFMYSNYDSLYSLNNQPNQMNSFEMRSNSYKNGITIWNDVFLYELPITGEKLAIILMETQEFFNSTSPMNNSKIFALGTLISSIQVLNINGVLDNDQMEYFKFATEFAKLSSADNPKTSQKPFQKLMLLIRDFTVNDDFTSGEQKYMKDIFNINQNYESIRSLVKDSFDKIIFSQLSNVSNDNFENKLKAFAENFLSPNQLVIKKINGEKLNSFEYLGYVQKYFELYKSQEILPDTKTLYAATVDYQINSLISECLTHYKFFINKRMEKLSNIDQIPNIHNSSFNKTVLCYRNMNKMENTVNYEQFEENLVKEIEKAYNQWKKEIEAKFENIEDENERKVISQLEAKINQCILNIELNNIKTAIEIFEEINDENQIERISKEIYSKNPKNIKFLLKFVRNLSNLKWTGKAYKTLQNYINVEHLMMLALNVKETMSDSNFQRANEEDKNLLEEVKSNFMPAIKAITWGGVSSIRNYHFNEFYYAEADHYNYDGQRRNLFTRRNGEMPKDSYWEFLDAPNGYRYIRHAIKKEYLYADTDFYAYDSDRRNVFTWIPKNKLDESFQWEMIFMPLHGVPLFLLKNRLYDEFLYAFDDPGPDQYRRRVFTWRKKTFDTQMFWSF